MFETLISKLQEDKYLTLETTPQHEPSMHNIVEKLKYNSLFAALKLQQEFKKPGIATMTMRDRNKIALQSDLLGANDFDIRAILALTGDPANMSDQPNSKGVFEANSLMLLKMIKSFNYGMDFAGRPFKIEPKQIFPFAVVNAYAKNFGSLEKKMHLKIQNGAVGVITQPVFDIENVKKLLENFENAKENVEGDKRKAQLIFGVFPITKLRTALFLSAQVPGIHVPQFWIDELERAHSISEEEEYKVGMQLSQNLYREINKIHLMTANNKFDVASEIIG